MLVWAGAACGWRWIRNPWFRYAHVAAIVFVAVETLAGFACPLTVWEDLLRGGARPESFVGRWLARLLYYQAPEWVFATAYVAWAAATLLTLRLAPPRAWRAPTARVRAPAPTGARRDLAAPPPPPH